MNDTVPDPRTDEERLRAAAEDVDAAWNDEGDHLLYHDELPESLLALRAALAAGPVPAPLDEAIALLKAAMPYVRSAAIREAIARLATPPEPGP
jgi:hypothetical protein